MTTPRAPYKTRRWTPADDATLRSMVDAGHDAREIGKEINRSFMGVQTRAKKLEIVFAKRAGAARIVNLSSGDRSEMSSADDRARANQVAFDAAGRGS